MRWKVREQPLRRRRRRGTCRLAPLPVDEMTGMSTRPSCPKIRGAGMQGLRVLLPRRHGLCQVTSSSPRERTCTRMPPGYHGVPQHMLIQCRGLPISEAVPADAIGRTPLAVVLCVRNRARGTPPIWCCPAGGYRGIRTIHVLYCR